MRIVLAAVLALSLPGCKHGGGGDDPDGGGPGDPDANIDPASCLDAGPGGTPGMIAIAQSTFQMGCEAAETPCEPDQQPKHSATVCAYEIDRTEVSQVAYQACIDDGACVLPFAGFSATSDSPVGWATWDMANAYCTWAGKRLPTEAEWELAARGTQGNKFPWGAAPIDCTLANAISCSDVFEPVDSFPQGASTYALVHMIGNASEWVKDYYGPYSAQAVVNPQGPSSGSFRVQRGGGFSFPGPGVLSNTWRDLKEQTDERDYAGFRCAK